MSYKKLAELIEKINSNKKDLFRNTLMENPFPNADSTSYDTLSLNVGNALLNSAKEGKLSNVTEVKNYNGIDSYKNSRYRKDIHNTTLKIIGEDYLT